MNDKDWPTRYPLDVAEDIDCWPIPDWHDPDWRNPHAYPPVKTTKPVEWAWNFWRRNAEVRMDWTERKGNFDPTELKPPQGWMNQPVRTPRMRTFEVDITQPLEPQLRAVLKILKKERATFESTAPAMRMRPSNYVTYLRVMDARSAYATLDDVADRLSTQKKTYSPDDIYALWEKARDLSWFSVVWLAYKPHTRHSRKPKKRK